MDVAHLGAWMLQLDRVVASQEEGILVLPFTGVYAPREAWMDPNATLPPFRSVFFWGIPKGNGPAL